MGEERRRGASALTVQWRDYLGARNFAAPARRNTERTGRIIEDEISTP